MARTTIVGKRLHQVKERERRPGDQERSLEATNNSESHQQFFITVYVQGHTIRAMIDSGAQGNFISPELVNRLRLNYVRKDEPYRLKTFDGSNVNYDDGCVDKEVAQLLISFTDRRHERLTLDITGISHDIILGIPWLRASNPRVNWKTGQFQWDTPGRDQSLRSRQIAAAYGSNTTSKEEGLDGSSADITRIPKEYQRYRDLFSGKLKTGLPKHSRWDHEIPLKPGMEPKFHKVYALSPDKQQALKEYLEENLRKGYIRPSKSPAGYPILFVPKKNGKLRLCVDYRQLNDITIKNRYPLPLIEELRDKLGTAQWFTALDLKGAYNLIRMKEGEEWKTAFRTREGLFEYLVMPFGLTNAPASFQEFINHVLREYLDIFVVVYLDDILIFSNTLEEHKKHVHKVLQTLQDNDTLVEPEKCEFHVQHVKFLGYEICPGEVRMDRTKLATIRDWPRPTNVREVQALLGFVNYYRRFIRSFGEIARPLTDLTKKDNEWKWDAKHEGAYEKLKQRMLEEPVLATPDPALQFEVETDASDYALGGVLGQRKEGKLHPVAFYSKKLHGPELNYPIHDKELMAIIDAFREWKHYLSGASHQVKVYTDHKNLTTFTTTKDLNKRQIRWSEFLSEFNFEIIYRKGSENGRADALSRREDLKPAEPVQPFAILRENANGGLELSTRQVSATWRAQPDQEWIERLRTAEDDFIRRGNPDLVKGQHGYTYKERQYVPEQFQHELVQRMHEHKLHGHQGVSKTLNRIRRTYEFPGLTSRVKTIIRSCNVCNKAKSNRHAPYGELQPISPPDRAWKCITMDFIVKLPPSREPMTEATYDSILVIVDKLTKYAYFIPHKESHTSEELAYTFNKVVAGQHGLPEEIISDRGNTFVSEFWTTLTEHLGIRTKLSTAFHPQTDGQTERTNQTLEQYLRSYINHPQNNWVELLPIAQWAYNSSTNDSISMSPFEANYGFNPTIDTYEATKVVPQATRKATEMTELHKDLQQEWIFLQNRMKHYADRRRVEGPTLKEGDKTYLLRKNIKTTRPSSKLDWKKLGPFRIKRIISKVNYELELPKESGVYPVFHVSLLEPAPPNAELETQLNLEDERQYIVQKILDERKTKNGTEYLVKWEGYSHDESTWEPKKNLRCSTEIREFHLDQQQRHRQAKDQRRKTQTNRQTTNQSYQGHQELTGPGPPTAREQ